MQKNFLLNMKKHISPENKNPTEQTPHNLQPAQVPSQGLAVGADTFITTQMMQKSQVTLKNCRRKASSYYK